MRSLILEALGSAGETARGFAAAAADRVSAPFIYTGQAISNQANAAISKTRNTAADFVEGGGNIIGISGAIAGETTLIMAGVFPFFVLGGLPTELAGNFVALTEQLAKSIRGDEPRFVAVLEVPAGWITNENREALIYDPKSTRAENNGFYKVSEIELAKMVRDQETPDLALTALTAVQIAKKQAGIVIDTVAVTSPSPEAPKPTGYGGGGIGPY